MLPTVGDTAGKCAAWKAIGRTVNCCGTCNSFCFGKAGTGDSGTEAVRPMRYLSRKLSKCGKILSDGVGKTEVEMAKCHGHAWIGFSDIYS